MKKYSKKEHLLDISYDLICIRSKELNIVGQLYSSNDIEYFVSGDMEQYTKNLSVEHLNKKVFSYQNTAALVAMLLSEKKEQRKRKRFKSLYDLRERRREKKLLSSIESGKYFTQEMRSGCWNICCPAGVDETYFYACYDKWKEAEEEKSMKKTKKKLKRLHVL